MYQIMGTFAQAYALQKFIHALNEKRDCKQIAYLNQRHFDFYYSRLPRCNPLIIKPFIGI